MRRIALHRRLMGLQGFIHPAQIKQRVAPVRSCGLAAQRLGPHKRLDGLRKSPLVMQQNPVHIHGLCVVAVNQQRPPKPRPGPRRVPLSRAELAPGH